MILFISYKRKQKRQVTKILIKWAMLKYYPSTNSSSNQPNTKYKKGDFQ